MADNNWLSTFFNSFMNQYKRPETGSAATFDPNSAFGANMVHGSNEQNPNPLRDTTNAATGANPAHNAFKTLLGGTSENVAQGLGQLAPGVAAEALPTLGSLLGGHLGGEIAGATGSVANAALQGGTNPMADVGAGASLFKLLRRLF